MVEIIYWIVFPPVLILAVVAWARAQERKDRDEREAWARTTEEERTIEQVTHHRQRGSAIPPWLAEKMDRYGVR